MENTISIGKAAKLLGVTVKTLQRREREGWLIPVARTGSNRRLYIESQIREFIGLRNGASEPTRLVAYYRVSSAAQKPALARFAAVRVRAAHRDYWRATLREPQWLLIEWPETESAPSHYFLCTLPENYSLTQLVYTAKMRWRIERDCRELKQEVGLGHYEGRNWRGFHHHATLTIAAYGFLLLQRLKGWNKKNGIFPQAPSLPPGYIPRGRPKSATPRTRLDRNDSSWDCATDRPTAPAMSLLRESA